MAISSTFLFSLSGLQTAVDRQAVTAHNVANVQTAGFKAHRATQADLRTGGTRINAIDTLAAQGPILRTGGVMDLAVAGDGFFQVRTAAGAVQLTRDGSFRLDGQGRLADAQGNLLEPPMTVPAGAQALQVMSDGRVGAVMPDGSVEAIGQIQLARAAVGAPAVGAPGQAGFGALIPGALEGSNVDLVNEMVNQIVDHRAFEANLKPIQTADEMLGTVLDLRE